MTTHITHSPCDASPLLLASQSPRRRRLLSLLGLPFSAVSVDTPENLDSPLASDPAALAVSLAAEKAAAVREEGLEPSGITLCFDTIVVLDEAVLGKPHDTDDAWRMLRALSGRTHRVITGVAMLLPAEKNPRTVSVATQVVMRPLDDAAILKWMKAGEYLGCAGAYNIEAQVALVSEDECYQNVAGIPLCHLHAALAAIHRENPDAALREPFVPIAACDAALGRRCRLGPRVVAGGSSH